MVCGANGAREQAEGAAGSSPRGDVAEVPPSQVPWDFANPGPWKGMQMFN